MARTKRRKPDLRQIRTTRTYKLPELAATLERTPATVRVWRREGLPTLDNQNPPMFSGAVVKSWLRQKWAVRKQKCQPDELYCFKCRRPEKPEPASLQIIPRNEKTITIKGRCSICGTRMNRAGSRARLAEIKEQFGMQTPHRQHLSEYGNDGVKRISEPNAVPEACEGDGEAQTAVKPGKADQTTVR